jgi:putative salt-induced outer membrane protein YdiY
MIWIVIALLQDTVTLNNGDRLSGKVVVMEKGVLTLETSYSKPVLIEVANIRSISTGAPVKVALVSGDVLHGKLDTANGKITVKSDTTSAELAWSQIKAINPPDVPPAKYKGFVSIAGSRQTGNTDRIAVSGAAEAERRTEDDRITFRFLTNYAEDEGELSSRNTFGMLKYDYFFSTKLYGYLNLELLNDYFKNLNLRTVAGAGVGYQWIEEPTLNLSFEAGAAYFNEDFRRGPDEDQMALRFAKKFGWTFREGMTFTNFFVVYPQLEDNEAIWRNEAKVTAALWGNWAASLAFIVDYDSDPVRRVPRVRKADFLTLLGIQFNFN